MKSVRRKDREIVKDEAYNLLKNSEYAILATINEDNTPYCIPFSPVVEGDFIYFHGALEGQKVENIKRSSNVCVTCVGNTRLVPENFTTEYESAVAHGVCEIVEDSEEKIFALRKICEKFAKSNMENFDKAIKASLHRTGVFKIEIKSLTGKAKKVKNI